MAILSPGLEDLTARHSPELHHSEALKILPKKKPFMCQLVEKLYESNSGVCVNTGLLCMQLADGRYSGQLSVGGVTSSDSIYVIIYCCSNKNTCVRWRQT